MRHKSCGRKSTSLFLLIGVVMFAPVVLPYLFLKSVFSIAKQVAPAKKQTRRKK